MKKLLLAGIFVATFAFSSSAVAQDTKKETTEKTCTKSKDKKECCKKEGDKACSKDSKDAKACSKESKKSCCKDKKTKETK